ncbi:cytosine deaminase [Erwinia tracheiphila PSU-1]|nr:cytosine deaminase [Erwinia tracheiphila PSU-1]
MQAINLKWINHVRLPWREGFWQIAIHDGTIASISPQPQNAPTEDALDA